MCILHALRPVVLATRAGVVHAVIPLGGLIPVIKDEIVALKHLEGHVNLFQAQISKFG